VLNIGTATLPAATFSGYFPIVATVTSGNTYVVGFGWAQVTISNGAVTAVTKLAQLGAGGSIAPVNASADVRFAWPTLGILPAQDLADVHFATANLADAVLAPVLVRSMSPMSN
jgi:hypothetical protein